MNYDQFLQFAISGEHAAYCVVIFCYITLFGGLIASLFYGLLELLQFLWHRIRLKLMKCNPDINKAKLDEIPLKPCPCCGCEAGVVPDTKKNFFMLNDVGYICCPNCDISTPSGNLASVALIWNTRYKEDKI